MEPHGEHIILLWRQPPGNAGRHKAFPSKKMTFVVLPLSLFLLFLSSFSFPSFFALPPPNCTYVDLAKSLSYLQTFVSYKFFFLFSTSLSPFRDGRITTCGKESCCACWRISLILQKKTTLLWEAFSSVSETNTHERCGSKWRRTWAQLLPPRYSEPVPAPLRHVVRRTKQNACT